MGNAQSAIQAQFNVHKCQKEGSSHIPARTLRETADKA